MLDTDVTHEGAQPAGAPEKGQGGKGKDESVTITKAELESLRRERDEARESEKFWAQRARSGGSGRSAPEPEPEEEIEVSDLLPEVTGDKSVDEAIFSDPDKWAEAVSRGPQAVEKFVRAKGFVTKSEAAEMAADIAAKVARRAIDVERQKMSSDNVIMRDFPELAKPDSELFRATAAEVKKLVALDPRAKYSPATLYAAAQTAAAKIEMKKPKERARPEPEDEDGYDRYEPEDDRRRRADAQDGTRNRGRDTEGDVDMLGPEARETIKQMGITMEEFVAARKDTTAMRPRGRR